jgi:ParB-like chromosome segregation protein Spo0J
MRLKAAQEVGLKEMPIILADDWTQEQKDEFLIKDNVGFGEWNWDDLANEWDSDLLDNWGLDVWQNDDLSNENNYNGQNPELELDKFLNAELKRMFLVYDNVTFENVIKWFNKQQEKHELENHSQVILKLMENENI